MSKVLVGIAMILGLGASGLAQASGAFTGRAGITGGGYNYEDEVTDTGCCGNPNGTVFINDEENDTTYGLLVGGTTVLGPIFIDLGIEYSTYNQADDFYRTDGLLTVGGYIGDRWTVFGGYRNATFGDGFFSEENGNTETGPFIGGGVSFRPGKKIALGASLAYNKLTLSFDGTTFEDIDIDGFSAKGQMSFLGTPHSVFLRYQRFDGEDDQTGNFGYIYEYTETYLNVGYQATFDFASW